MKAKLQANDKLSFEFEGDDQKAIFKQIAVVQEVFDENKCGECGNADLRFVVRTVEENDFYEIQCKKCYSKLTFGQHKKGKTLFPKRKDDDGKFIGKNGWHKYVPDKK